MSTIDNSNAKSMCFSLTEFDSCKDDDYRNEYDCSESSAKASSSSMHDSLTNMSNCHSTPDNDTFSETAAMLSPIGSNKHRLDYNQSDAGLLVNSQSIDDTIESVLTKFRSDNDVKPNKMIVKPGLNELNITNPSNCLYKPVTYPNHYYQDMNCSGFYLSQLTNLTQYSPQYRHHAINNFQIRSGLHNMQNYSYNNINHSNFYPQYSQSIHNQNQFKMPTQMNYEAANVHQLHFPTNNINNINYNPRKKRNNTEKPAANSSKKRKLTQHHNTNEQLLIKLRSVNYNTLLTNPTVQLNTDLLAPLGYTVKSSKSQVKYSKYSSTVFSIKKSHLYNDNKDKFLEKHLTSTPNKLLGEISRNNEDYLDIIQPSPLQNYYPTDSIKNHTLLGNVSSDSSNYANCPSPFLTNSNTSCVNNAVESSGINNCLTQFSSNKQQNALLCLPESENPTTRQFVQLNGSFLKRTKINGKTLSNIHIEEAISLNALTESSTNDYSTDSTIQYTNCSHCELAFSSSVCWNFVSDDKLFCSSTCYHQFKFNSSNNAPEKMALTTPEIMRIPRDFYSSPNIITQVIIKTNSPYHKLSKTMKRVCDFDQYVRRRFPSEDGAAVGSNVVGTVGDMTSRTIESGLSDNGSVCGVQSNTRLKQHQHKYKGLKYCTGASISELANLVKEISKSDEASLLAKYNCVYHEEDLVDERSCSLCENIGDGDDNICGRLINLSGGTWIHLNCALWCFDVFETVSGCLMELPAALSKASVSTCTSCGKLGAGLHCYRSKCLEIFHVGCAYSSGCVFYTDRGMYCRAHAVYNHPMHLETLCAPRRVVVYRDESQLVGQAVSSSNLCDDLTDDNSPQSLVRTGSLALIAVGQLLPEQLMSGKFNSSSVIYPVGFHSTRIYWSINCINSRCKYHCHIDEENNAPLFRITVSQKGYPTHNFTDTNCDSLWKSLLTKIAQMREKSGLTKLFPQYLSGEQLYGLIEPQIIRVVESLPGVEMIDNYAFKFGKMQLITEMPLAINPTGCARTEPKLRTYVRRQRQFSASSESSKLTQCGVLNAKTSQHQHQLTSLPLSNVNATNTNTSASSLGNHYQVSISRSVQYKKMRHEWMNNVTLTRSKIQGLGLLAARDMDKSTIIIEYIGELIRNEVANRREKMYEARNNSIYMFRLNEDWIIDATLRGGLARYINHSCNPNCVAETLSMDCGDHIVITTKHKVHKGEELTYDYKFDYADTSASRIPCLCASINCRNWMN